MGARLRSRDGQVPGDAAALCEAEHGEGLVLLHDRLVKAAVEIKATTTSLRNRNIVCLTDGGQCS